MDSDGTDFIKSVALFSELSDDQVKKVAKICSTRMVRQGEVIMTEGEVGETLYLLREGEVEIVKALTLKRRAGGFEEGEKAIVKLRSDDVNFFGEMTLLSRAPRSATVRSVTDSVLYEIRTDAIDRLCSEDADLGYKIMRALGARLTNVVEKNNKDILKLTTALSLSLNNKK